MCSTERLLLAGINDGRVVREETPTQRGYWALYKFSDCGHYVDRWELTALKRKRWIDLPMVGPPRITEDGASWLRAQIDH